jgi:hypothetical protein
MKFGMVIYNAGEWRQMNKVRINRASLFGAACQSHGNLGEPYIEIEHTSGPKNSSNTRTCDGMSFNLQSVHVQH